MAEETKNMDFGRYKSKNVELINYICLNETRRSQGKNSKTSAGAF